MTKHNYAVPFTIEGIYYTTGTHAVEALNRAKKHITFYVTHSDSDHLATHETNVDFGYVVEVLTQEEKAERILLDYLNTQGDNEEYIVDLITRGLKDANEND